MWFKVVNNGRNIGFENRYIRGAAVLSLTGEYFPNIDNKGRMNFPSRLREELGERFYITRWVDSCLAVFSEEEWKSVCEKINSQSFNSTRDAQRQLSSNACLVEPDKQGRISIPQSLRERAGITAEVAVIGAMNRAEIWDRARWQRRCELSDDQYDDIILRLNL